MNLEPDKRKVYWIYDKKRSDKIYLAKYARLLLKKEPFIWKIQER